MFLIQTENLMSTTKLDSTPALFNSAGWFDSKSVVICQLSCTRSRVNTSYGSRCIKFKASQLWNTIPEELKLINKLNSFKNQLKSHLFNDIKY